MAASRVRSTSTRDTASTLHGIAALIAIPRANRDRTAVSGEVRCLRIRCNQTQNHLGKYRAICQSQFPELIAQRVAFSQDAPIASRRDRARFGASHLAWKVYPDGNYLAFIESFA